MRQKAWIVAFVLAAAGLGAETPSTTHPPDDALARILSTPRYYLISASGAMKAQNGNRMCFGGEPLRKLVDSFREIGKDPRAIAAVSKGCTNKTVRDGRTVSVFQDCEKANGALFTSHMRLSGTPDEFHQHFEVMLSGLGPNGGDSSSTSDVVMTYLGQCPGNVKPGQVLRADGVVSDPFAALTAKSGEAKGLTGARAPK
jgi:hypothetical protein